MRILFGLTAMATALAPATAAERKPLPGNPDDLSVQAVYNYAACIVETTPRGAEEALALDFTTPAYDKKLRALAKGHADSRCMSASQIRSRSVLIAGGMAEKLLVKKVDPARFPALIAYDASKPSIAAHDVVEVTAMCMVRAEPAKSWAVFATPPTSREEGEAIQALTPTLQSCVPAGQKMAVNKPGLRALLALAAYHMTQPASPAQGS
jgi:hypothetical protein